MRVVGLPNAAIRMGRAPVGAALVAVLVLLIVVTGQLTESSQVALTGTVDRHWRGSYDLLVRPSGSRLSLESTDGLVEPNFLSFTGHGGIDEQQLAAIRQLPGVELAAPVAVVGYIRYSFSAPSVFISNLPKAPTLYRLSLTATTSDGLTERLVQGRTSRLLIGPADLTAAHVPFASDERDMSYGADGVSIGFPELPGIVSPLIAVDPVAEQALLGETASFLAPFSKLGDSRSDLRVSNFDQKLIPADLAAARFFINLLGHQSDAAAQRPIVPLVVSKHLYTPLTLRLSIEQVGAPLRSYPTADSQLVRLSEAAQAAGPELTAVGSTNLDLTNTLRPFDTPSMTILWPGSKPPNGTEIASRVDDQFVARLAGRPTYQPMPGNTLTFRIDPVGLVDPSGVEPPGNGPDGAQRGVEQAYRTFTSSPLATGSSFQQKNPFDRPFVFAPIGEFDLATLDLPTDSASYVPLGAYDPPQTTLLGASGPRPMSPTLNAAGFIEVPPLAVTDLAGARLLRGNAPIDAIRVRVAGLTGFTADARSKVEQVASAIAGRGLDVDIVAGSSPQNVRIYVPGYDTLNNPATDLGYVSQPWTTLGAAQRVERTLGGLNVNLLVLVLLLTCAFTVTAEGLVGAIRRREVTILRSIGWTRLRLVGWYGSEIVLLAVILVPVALWSSGFGARPVGLAAGLVILVVATTVRAVGIVSAYRRSAGSPALSADSWLPRWLRLVPPVSGPLTLAIRTTVGRVTRTAAAVIAIGIGTGGLGAAAALVIGALREAGPTRLAASVGGDLRPYQLLLLATLSVGSIGLTLLLGRVDSIDRRVELRVLAAAGWTARRIAIAVAAQFALWAAVGGALGVIVALALGRTIGVGSTGVLILASVAIVVASTMPLIVLARVAGHEATSMVGT